MTIARSTEITASSKKSFDDAIQSGIKRATRTLRQVSAAWISDQEVMIENDKIVEYRVRMKITFLLEK